MVLIDPDLTDDARPAHVTHAVMGHFGELVQGRLGAEGPVAAITLPCPALSVRAAYRPGGRLRMRAAGPSPLALAQVAKVFAALGREPAGRLALRADMPLGGGAGSSTAALLAVAAVNSGCCMGGTRSPEDLARICLEIEGATDPLMFADPATRLWSPRTAETLARLPPLPAIEIVGGFSGPGLRTDPADLGFADVADLIAAWPEACARGDPRGIAALASASATRNAARRGGSDLGRVRAIGQTHGALGVVAAHTGSAQGLIFAPGQGAPAAAVVALRAAGFACVVRFGIGDRSGACA